MQLVHRIVTLLAIGTPFALGGPAAAAKGAASKAKAPAPIAATCPDHPEFPLDNLSVISRQARLVPELRDGKAVGLRVYSLRDDNPLSTVGLVNGDVMLAINGVGLTSAAAAMEAYARMQAAPCSTLIVEREGARIELPFRALSASIPDSRSGQPAAALVR